MRFTLMLLPLAGLGMAGCALDSVPSTQRTSTTYLTPARSEVYMTPDQSATLMTTPGASTTVGKMRDLPTTSLNDDSGGPVAVWPQQ
jgi:hypothetical protein